ncbi:MAG: hypothetical protein IKP40_14645 [Clostridia bacterium]|nr:hypothetical protein [Clostridia bacterium]
MRLTEETERLRLTLRQGAENAAKRQRACPGRFISAADKPLAVHEARDCGVEAFMEGGWPGAERMQVCFVPEGEEPLFTAVWLRIDWDRRFDQVSHRDLLGSLLGLGIDRSYTGDLILQVKNAWLFALPELARRLPEEWLEAGRVPIRVSLCEEKPEITPPRGSLCRETVASLRLDAVLAAGMRLSRARTAELIRAGRVSVNHQMEERPDVLLNAGDLLSIRGAGRVRLTEIGGRTRKDRVSIEMERFLHKDN